ncbi:MAG: hypothetical protein ACFB4I_14225 [Cyanophyceae cyanobacterium]
MTNRIESDRLTKIEDKLDLTIEGQSKLNTQFEKLEERVGKVEVGVAKLEEKVAAIKDVGRIKGS